MEEKDIVDAQVNARKKMVVISTLGQELNEKKLTAKLERKKFEVTKIRKVEADAQP